MNRTAGAAKSQSLLDAATGAGAELPLNPPKSKSLLDAAGAGATTVGAGAAESLCERIDRLHHQVHIDGHIFAIGRFGMGLQRLANHGAKREVGHVMVVHHVVMNPVGAGSNDIAHFFTQTGKVGRQQ